jgi:hypothetical protein
MSFPYTSGKKRLTEKALRITIKRKDPRFTGALGMRTCLLQKILSCIMIIIVPAALFAADSGAAMLYSNGTSWLNGSSLPKSSAIFSGDLVQTAAGSIAKINASGSSLMVLSDSLVQFESSAVTLKHGGVAVSTSKAMATRAGDVTVTPTASVWTQFDVTDVDGKVQIAARKGDLTIDDGTGATTLAQGQQTTRDESDTQKTKKQKSGAGGAAPAAGGGILNSKVAIGIGVVAVAGVTTWVLLQDGEPASPTK